MRTLNEITNGESFEMFIQKCKMDIGYWAEHVFGLDITPFHKKWLADTYSHKYNCIVAARGLGKTMLMGIVLPLWYCYFNRRTEVLVTANAMGQATRIMDKIKDALEENELLKDLLPASKYDGKYNETQIVLSNKSIIYCMPYTPNIKGLHVDYVLCDEAGLYTDTDVFIRTISPIVEVKKGRIVVIGTPESETDLLSQLKANPRYYHSIYRVVNDDGTPIWPQRYSAEGIVALRQTDENAFQKEYMCNPKAGAENQIYSPTMVSECFSPNDRFISSLSEGGFAGSLRILACDFAIASGPRADFDAYTVIERVGGAAYLRWGERHKGLPIIGKVQKIKELYDRYRPSRIILDPSSVGSAVIEELRNLGLPVEAADFTPSNRNKMLVDLRRMLEEKRLIIPRDMNDPLTATFTNILFRELIDFKEVKTKTGLITYQSIGAHDDTVMSLAMAVKGVSAQREYIDFVAI
jgi:hypothetical protein